MQLYPDFKVKFCHKHQGWDGSKVANTCLSCQIAAPTCHTIGRLFEASNGALGCLVSLKSDATNVGMESSRLTQEAWQLPT